MTRQGSTLTAKCVKCSFSPRAHSLFISLSERMNGANVHKIRQMLLVLQLAEGECEECRRWVKEYERVLPKL